MVVLLFFASVLRRLREKACIHFSHGQEMHQSTGLLSLCFMQEIVQETMHGTTEILRGMTSQYAEADDIVIVEDIRSEQSKF